jgi:hypothetical protein
MLLSFAAAVFAGSVGRPLHIIFTTAKGYLISPSTARKLKELTQLEYAIAVMESYIARSIGSITRTQIAIATRLGLSPSYDSIFSYYRRLIIGGLLLLHY